MKECDILAGQNILWPHIFRGIKTSSIPHDLRPWKQVNI